MIVCIYDIPILIVLGAVIAYIHSKYIIEKHPDFYAHISFYIILIFWLNILLSNIGIMKVWFGLFKMGFVRVNFWIGIFHTLSYLLWYFWGSERAYQLFGRNPSQGGFLWPFTLKDKTKPFKRTWK